MQLLLVLKYTQKYLKMFVFIYLILYDSKNDISLRLLSPFACNLLKLSYVIIPLEIFHKI